MSTKTHYTFEADGKTWSFPDIMEVPAGFNYYQNKISKQVALPEDKRDNTKLNDYGTKIMEFLFGIETDTLDAFMSFTGKEQGEHIQAWLAFETEKHNLDAGKS